MSVTRLIVFALVLSIVLSLVFTACGKKETKLRIGTNAEYPPFESQEGGNYVGVDMDLGRKIAEKLGMDFEIIDMDFDTLIPSLGANKIDLAISAITITDDRRAQVDFTEPYYVANQVIIAKQGSKIALAKPEDVVKYKVGAQNGTTGQLYLSENFIDKNLMPKDNLKKYPTNIEAISDLLNGNLDFVIIDDSAARGYAKLRPLDIVLQIDTNENYGIALPKKGPLNEKINTALNEIIASGEMESIIQAHVK